jgi:hypothetical protein
VGCATHDRSVSGASIQDMYVCVTCLHVYTDWAGNRSILCIGSSTTPAPLADVGEMSDFLKESDAVFKPRYCIRSSYVGRGNVKTG